MMTKEQIFDEFKIAKDKDIAKSTSKPPYENVFTNRLNVLRSHRDAKKSHPKSYRHLDINFENLILAYSAPVPVDHFYKTIFNKTLSEYEHDKRLADLTEKQKERQEAKKLKEKEDEKTVVSIN
jgi:hypothetical protein